jgi:hypothetical protein
MRAALSVKQSFELSIKSLLVVLPLGTRSARRYLHG